MRKFGALLLAALIVLLTACGQRPAETPPVPVPSAAPTAAAPETADNVFKEVILPNGPLPQAAYEPPAAPPRFYAEVVHTLIPKDDYGRIWPYIGGYAVQMWMSGVLLGLCDEEGRIICDPVYNQAAILEKDGKRLYMLTENLKDSENRNVSKITLAKLDGSWAKEYEGVAYECADQEFMGEGAFSWRQNITYDYITVCETEGGA